MDTQKLIAELHRENLCTYFVLPLLKINKDIFVSGLNFVDSFLTRDGKDIFVWVNETTFFLNRVALNPQFETTWNDTSGNKYIQFSIPEKWHADVQLFIKGKYSLMSEKAKQMIRQHSGLQYRERRETDKVIVTDIRLLALNRSIAVRELWQVHYGVTLDEHDELLSLPERRAFIDKLELFKEDECKEKLYWLRGLTPSLLERGWG